MSGKLILVPTPLDEELPLETIAHGLLARDALNENVVLLVEEHKVARQRWIKWGLPREAIERFVLFNEHTQNEEREQILSKLKAHKIVYLMSDGGLPAFYDPGQKLVKACHEKGIPVTSTPFSNSISLAVALSGIDHSKFSFAGFLSTDQADRKKEIEQIASRNETVVIMDTPYRLNALITDLGSSRLKGRRFFLATNLNSVNERNFYGSFSDIQKASESLHKPEFVFVISGS